MGNSQSYDVTNVHHRDSGQRDETMGTVKQLRDDIRPRIDIDERDKQENKSPKPSSRHQELSATTQHKEKSNISETPKEPTACAKNDEGAVSDVTHGMSEIALESLYRVVPPETLPLDAKPAQCSYD